MLQLLGRAGLLAFLFILLIPRINASTSFFSGNLRANATVMDCGSGCTLSAADSDADWAQWAARVETFTVAVPSYMDAITFTYGGGTSATGPVIAAGGFSPYLSLFDNAGNFLVSTYLGTYCPAGAYTDSARFDTCYDVQLDGGLLAPGTYSIAVSVYSNMSFAENLGMGTLADGFTGLGNLDGTLDYAFDLNLTSQPVPEPATLALSTIGLAGLIAVRRVRKTR